MFQHVVWTEVDIYIEMSEQSEHQGRYVSSSLFVCVCDCPQDDQMHRLCPSDLQIHAKAIDEWDAYFDRLLKQQMPVRRNQRPSLHRAQMPAFKAGIQQLSQDEKQEEKISESRMYSESSLSTVLILSE